MSTASKNKTLHYKLARFDESEDLTLQQLLVEACEVRTKPKERKEPLDNQNSVRLLNRTLERGGMFFGELIYYEHGKKQSAVIEDDDDDFYSIESLGLPKNSQDGKKREYLESELIFAVYGNHIAILQSKLLRASELESYLWWFLVDCSKILSKDKIFVLSDEPTVEARQQIESVGGTKNIIFGAPVLTGSPETINTTKSKKVSKTKQMLFKPFGIGNDILEAAFGVNWANKVKLTDSLDGANLEIELKVKYQRNTTEEAHKLLDTLAITARHTDPEHTKIVLADGTLIEGDKMKITGPIKVPYLNDVVDFTKLCGEMMRWLQKRFKNGEIR